MPSYRVALRQLPRAELVALAEAATDYLEEVAPLRFELPRSRDFRYVPPWLLAEHVLVADYVRERLAREARASAA